MSDLVKTEVIDQMLVITLNRPEARNAISMEAALQLAAALDRLDNDDDIVLGVLTGADRKSVV